MALSTLSLSYSIQLDRSHKYDIIKGGGNFLWGKRKPVYQGKSLLRITATTNSRKRASAAHGEVGWLINDSTLTHSCGWLALKGVKTEWMQLWANWIHFAIYAVKSKQTYQTSKTTTMTRWLEVRYALQFMPVNCHLLPLYIPSLYCVP